MSNENLCTLIENIEGTLETLLVSGFNVANTSTIKTMEELSEQCESAGLSFAGEMLKAIASGQERKRHDMTYNSEEIMRKYFLLNNYISITKSKLDMERARAF
jgi:hypothetical protein